MSITLVLPYPISANRYWRALVINGHPAMVPTKEAKAYKAEVGWLARQAGMRAPLAGRMSLQVRLFPARPQDWAKRARKNPDAWDDEVRCIDLGNCEKVLSDALNGVAWVDDKQLRRIVLERCEPDDLGARLVVTVEPAIREAIAPGLFHEEPAPPPVATDIACAPAREEAA